MIRWKQALQGGVALGGALLCTLVSVAAAELWQAKGDHERRLTTMEVESRSDRDLLLEVRQDVKEILRRESGVSR